ncbi:sororin isoform X3 [Homo sapiens]|uniref:sororin isoform X3 n=1 Tax=Homo sapiens TaxID=9606 RepID=UPI0005D024D9|nr:sororin isoform X3 [Homo sapiens]XP_054223561.1 sororin isoform X3 [Homo sapiens]|eukprot:XP_011543045.1 sororin isoform X3 [Homo sapiens]
MSGRRTRSGGAAQRSGPRAPSPTKPLRRSQRKSGSELPSILPEIWPKTPSAAAVRKPIVLKRIVAHAVEVPAVQSPRRSPRISFFLEKENEPPGRELTKEDLFKTHSVPATPTSTPVPNPEAESSSKEGELDARDLEMSKKVRRSYSRLETLGSASTSTPGRRSCFGFEGLLGAEDLSGVSPVVCSKLTEVPRVCAKPWAPDMTLPGISPPPEKQKRKKKKMPEILSLRGRQRAHSKLANKPVVQPVEEQEPKGPQASEERNLEPPSSEQLEPTVTFLFTLLNTSEPTEPKDPESDSEIQEYQFLDQEDWGPQRTSKEIRQLQNDCMRLRESLNTTQVHNLALGEKLQNLPTLLYKSLKEGAQAIQEEAQAIQDEVKALQEESQALPEVALLRETTAKRMEIQGCLSVFTTWCPGGHVTLQAHPGARVQAQKKQKVSQK